MRSRCCSVRFINRLWRTGPVARLDIEVRRAETAIRAWFPALDAPVTSREQTVVVGLGLRGIALYRGLIHACSGPTPTIAAEADLRALVDLVILIRWIEMAPALHIDMWLAEDDRGRITLGEKWGEMHRRRGSSAGPAFTSEEVATMREGLAKVRAAARTAGEHVGEKGAMMPSIEHMAAATDDLFEAYQIAYRSLSPSSHSGARSFVRDTAEQRADGWHLKPSAAWEPLHLRALGVPLMCFLVASVSRQLSLNLETRADQFRVEFTKWRMQDAQ